MKSYKQLLLMILFLSVAVTSHAERIPWKTGHGDLQIDKDSTGSGLVIEEVAKIPIDDISIELNDASKLYIPDNQSFNFLGEPGKPIWVGPQIDDGKSIYYGVNSDIEPGFFADNKMQLDVLSLKGPGDFFVWFNGSGGDVNIDANSADGLDENDFLPLLVPAHRHQNWGFSKPGTYKVGVSASGILASNSQPVASPEEILHFEIALLKTGEVDIEVEYEDGDFEMILLVEETGQEIGASEAALFGGMMAWQPVPDNEAFGFLGEAGSPIAVLPQNEDEDLLFLGLATDELEEGVFEGDSVTISLAGVDGPGDFHLYSVDTFSNPTVLLSSTDESKQMIPVSVGEHAHFNWAFTKPGYYEVSVLISGTLQGTENVITSDPITLLFEIQNPFGDVVLLSSGEVDIEVEYEDGDFELLFLAEESGEEYGPSEAALFGGAKAWQPVPDNEAFGFLGEAGNPIAVLPQNEDEDLLFLGLATDELEEGVFEGDSVTISLAGVDGPGDFHLYSVDTFSNPTVLLSSTDESKQMIPVSVGEHAHFNWAFSAAGTYSVSVVISATLQGTDTVITSEPIVVNFQIDNPLPEPVLLTTGEVDIEVEFEDDNFELILIAEESGQEYEASEVVLFASRESWDAVPENEMFEFLGEPWDLVAILPQNEDEDLLFLGLASDELEAGVFEGDQVQIQLVSLNGPGDFTLYTVDTFGVPMPLLSSTDDNLKSIDMPVGGHAHYNWAFTEPGTYGLELTVAGTLAGTDTVITSETVTLNFQIAAPFDTILTRGEVDIEIEYEDDNFELILIDEQSETAFEADQVLLQAGPEVWEVIPENEAFNFLGSAWDPIAILPQVEEEGILFLGLASDELEAGVFEGDKVEIQLAQLYGPGEFALYSVDTFGTPMPLLSSMDENLKSMDMPVGGHAHYNWAFTEPGTYGLELVVSGTLAGTDTVITSEVVTLYFEIVSPFESILSEGEVDIEVEFEDGGFEFLILDELGGGEYGASNVGLHATSSAWQNKPVGPDFAFLGAPGLPIAVLPQNEEEGLLFLGLATDELQPGVFEGDQITVKLEGLNGPGDFFLYAVDTFSNPTVFLSSTDPEKSEFDMPIGQHAHYNWGFTRPGLYDVDLTITATLAGTDTVITSEMDTLYIYIEAPFETVLSKGEVDIEVEFEDGGFELLLLDELGGGEYGPMDVLLHAGSTAWQNTPQGPGFAFLGAPGQPIAILPQSEDEDLLFLGLATDELEAGSFEGEKISIKLEDLNGPGDFFLYAVDTFSNPTIYLSSTNPELNEFDMPIGQHAHYNWGFTRPGLYKIGLVISAQLAGSDDMIMSETIVLNFQVDPPMENLNLSISLGEGSVSLGWQTRPGFTYQVQSSQSLTSGSWQDVGPNVPGDGLPKMNTVPTGGEAPDQLFFRIIERRVNP